MGRKPTLKRTVSTTMTRKAQATEETNQRLPTPTAEEEKEAIPNLIGRQQAALNARAQNRFGVDAAFANTFAALKKGMVIPIVLRYTAQLGSAVYLQEVVELTLAKLTADMYGHLIEAEFERPTHLSYSIGSADSYALAKDGTVWYFNSGWKEWLHLVPRWEFAGLPVAEPVRVGFDL
jgi:hypothetical protein